MSTLDHRIGQAVRAYRRQAGLTQNALAGALRVSLSHLRRYERGTLRIGPRRLWRIAQILGCPLAAFFDHRLASSVVDERPSAGLELRPAVRRQGLALAEAFYLVGDFRHSDSTEKRAESSRG